MGEPGPEDAKHDAQHGGPWERLGVHAHEVGRTALLGTYLFLASCVFVLGRTVRDALFLSHYGPDAPRLLPWMFIAYGLTSALVALLWTPLQARLRRGPLVRGFSLVAGLSYVLLRLLVASPPGWLFGFVYVWAEVLGNLTVALFWAVAVDLHDTRSAKRLFGYLGLGRIAGMVLCGLGVGSFVREVGTENLLLALALLYALCFGLVGRLESHHGLGAVAPPATGARSGPLSMFVSLREPYVRALAAMLVLGFVVLNVGDFQFKAAARLVHPDRDSLAHFMALYYATVGGVALLLQVLLTRPLLRRFGVAGGMLALPVAFLLATVAFGAAPYLGFATAMKVADNAFQYTIFDATLQLLYFPLGSARREQLRGLLDAVAKPAGYALAGVVVLGLRVFLPPDSLRHLATQGLVVLPLGVLWLALVPLVRRLYLRQLERSLGRRASLPPAETASDEPATVALLERSAREDPAPRAVLYALEQLALVAPDAAARALPSVLARPEKELRVAGLELAAKLRAKPLRARVLELLEDPEDAVAGRAAETLGALDGEDCIESLLPLLGSERRSVQDAALVTLLRDAGFEGQIAAGSYLHGWLRAAEPEVRRRTAQLLGRARVPGLRRVLGRLLSDEDLEVRRAALVAAGQVLDASHLDAVVAALREPELRPWAARALPLFGAVGLSALARALEDRSTPREVRLVLPRLVAQTQSPRALAVLLPYAADPDEWLRQKVLASASRCRRTTELEAREVRRLEPRIVAELEEVSALLERYRAARPALARALLDRWMMDRLRRGLIRALRVAELCMTRQPVAAARVALFAPDAARRARAIELVENLFAPAQHRRLVKLVDDWQALREATLPSKREEGPEARARGQRFVAELLALPEDFAHVLALDAAQAAKLEVPEGAVEACLAGRDGRSREAAAIALAVCRPEGWRARLEKLRGDEDARVAAYVDYVLRTGHDGMDPEDELYTTLEKVLLLQRVEAFREVPSEHLLALARDAEVQRARAGTQVFRAGEVGSRLYFVLEGAVRSETPGGRTVDLGEGEVFGELSAFDPAPRSDTVTVLHDATLLALSHEDFFEVLLEVPELSQAVIRVLARRLRESASRGPQDPHQ